MILLVGYALAAFGYRAIPLVFAVGVAAVVVVLQAWDGCDG